MNKSFEKMVLILYFIKMLGKLLIEYKEGKVKQVNSNIQFSS